jgi:hypothetical protein
MDNQGMTNDVTDTLRHILHIGPRTQRRRNGLDMHSEIMRVITYATTEPGYYSPEKEAALRPAYGAYMAWSKHVDGYRLPGRQIAELRALTPWQLTALIGEMARAGVACTGDGEEFFAARRLAEAA